jgi:hypothetical protein
LLKVKQLSSALKHGFTTENAENIEQEFSWKLLRGLCDLGGHVETAMTHFAIFIAALAGLGLTAPDLANTPCPFT